MKIRQARSLYRKTHSEMKDIEVLIETPKGEQRTVLRRVRVFTGPGFKAWARSRLRESTSPKLQRLLTP